MQRCPSSFAGLLRRLQPLGARCHDTRRSFAAYAVCRARHDHGDSNAFETSEQSIRRSILSLIPSRFQGFAEDALLEEGDEKRNALRLGNLLYRKHNRNSDPLDNVLYDLAVEEEKWSAVVCISRMFMQYYGGSFRRTNASDRFVQRGASTLTLQQITNSRYGSATRSATHSDDIIFRSPMNVDSALARLASSTIQSNPAFSHQVLGTIWHALGLLILSSIRNGESAVRREVLEILALFHHHDLIPHSIYEFIPNNSADAVQQSPMLYLLSSHIMKAMTDAAWRAREASALESARREGRDLSSARLEMLGGSVTARIYQVRPEVWMEVVLWSCLHGGWHKSGAKIIEAIAAEEGDAAWSAVSWKADLTKILPFGQTQSMDWQALESQIANAPRSFFGNEQEIKQRVLSSEVLEAFVEVLASTPKQSMPTLRVLQYLRMIREFLQRSRLNLHGGTWDAVVSRLIENGVIDETNSGEVIAASDWLLPLLGDELQSRDTQVLPSYVLDGNAASLGVLHQNLRSQIDKGHIRSATATLEHVQKLSRLATGKSMDNFFTTSYEPTTSKGSKKPKMFDERFAGIEHPILTTHLPADLLAGIVHLAAETKSFNLGSRLVSGLNSIQTSLREVFGVDEVAPALVRYASATDDVQLFDRAVQYRLEAMQQSGSDQRSSRALLSAILLYQLGSKDWDGSERLLQQFNQDFESQWDLSCLAVLGKTIYIMQKSYADSIDIERAWQLFDSMVANRTARATTDTDDSEMTCIIAMLSSIHEQFASFLPDKRAFYDCPTLAHFNIILDGVAFARGSEGMKLFTRKYCAPAQERILNMIEYQELQDQDNDDLSQSQAAVDNIDVVDAQQGSQAQDSEDDTALTRYLDTQTTQTPMPSNDNTAGSATRPHTDKAVEVGIGSQNGTNEDDKYVEAAACKIRRHLTPNMVTYIVIWRKAMLEYLASEDLIDAEQSSRDRRSKTVNTKEIPTTPTASQAKRRYQATLKWCYSSMMQIPHGDTYSHDKIVREELREVLRELHLEEKSAEILSKVSKYYQMILAEISTLKKERYRRLALDGGLYTTLPQLFPHANSSDDHSTVKHLKAAQAEQIQA